MWGRGLQTGAEASGGGAETPPSHSAAGREPGGTSSVGASYWPNMVGGKRAGQAWGAFLRGQPPRAGSRVGKGRRASEGSAETFQHSSPLGGRKSDVQAGRRSLGRVFNLQKSSSVSLDLQARGRLLASHTDHLQSGSSPETPISARLFSAVQVPAGEADQRKSTRSTFESRTILSCLASTGKRFYWVPLSCRVLSGR